MTTWILILTLVYNHEDTAAFAIDNVPGFQTLEDCEVARDQWNALGGVNSYYAHRAHCVKQPAKPAGIPRR